MARASRRGKRDAPAVAGLPETKSREVVGVLLALAALLLLVALVSHRPDDPSWLRSSTEADSARNWIGPVGAQISASILGFIGLASFLLPAYLGVAAWRRLQRVPSDKVVGRGIGSVIVLFALPSLLQLVIGDLGWRGDSLRSGGVVGSFAADQLSLRLGFVCFLFLLLRAVVIVSTLIVQSSL